MEIKFMPYPKVKPDKDGEYLAVTAMTLFNNERVIVGVSNIRYIADDKEGGWNCVRVGDKIRNTSRLSNVVAWADCLNDIQQEVLDGKLD